MINSPAGTTTISGQSLAHSLNDFPGFSAFSCVAVSTKSQISSCMYGNTVMNQFRLDWFIQAMIPVTTPTSSR